MSRLTAKLAASGIPGVAAAAVKITAGVVETGVNANAVEVAASAVDVAAAAVVTGVAASAVGVAATATDVLIAVGTGVLTTTTGITGVEVAVPMVALPVETGIGLPDDAHTGDETRLVSSVTAPVCASTLLLNSQLHYVAGYAVADQHGLEVRGPDSLSRGASPRPMRGPGSSEVVVSDINPECDDYRMRQLRANAAFDVGVGGRRDAEEMIFDVHEITLSDVQDHTI